MRYIRDELGRLNRRPHYEEDELDEMCEQIITSFMRERCGELVFPIPTDVLTKLIERDTTDLDLYADLAAEGDDVEGVTYYFPNQPPVVRISNRLSANAGDEHRLRTTLTHEYGHVYLHAPLWRGQAQTMSMFPEFENRQEQKCHRSGIYGQRRVDWMEWQAGYACGALLMPHETIRHETIACFAQHGIHAPVYIDAPAARELVARVVNRFNVSRDAARVRLLQLHFLTEHWPTRSLLS